MAVINFALLTAFLSLFPPIDVYPPLLPEGTTTVNAEFRDRVTTSYQKPGICETTLGAKSYAGYAHLPPDSLVYLILTKEATSVN